jgi:hypothetical protein
MRTFVQGLARTRQAAIAFLVAIIMSVFLTASASAFDVIRSHGTTAPWEANDDAVAPFARCRYEGAAGTFFLRKVRGREIGVLGTESPPQSVAYRLLLQQRTLDGWKTTQRGELISGVTGSLGAVLPASRIRRDPNVSPNSARYRLAFKIYWFDDTAQVTGFVVASATHHRRSYDGSDGHSCRGRVPIAP